MERLAEIEGLPAHAARDTGRGWTERTERHGKRPKRRPRARPGDAGGPRRPTSSCASDLDGEGEADVQTGIGFFDHMLTAFARHGLFDLSVRVDGDLHVDGHHTVEDTGLCLGQALPRRWETRRASGASAARTYPWTTPWCWRLWI